MNWNSARGYCWDRALRLVGRRPARTLAAIAVVAAALTAPGLAFMVAQMLAPYADRIPVAEVTAFVAAGTPTSEVKALQGRLEEIDGVAQVRLLPRDVAWAELQRRAPPTRGTSDFGSNPLPDVLVVEFASQADPSVVEAGATSVRKQPRIESVQADLEWYRRFLALSRVAVAAFATLAAAVTLLLVSLLVIVARNLIAMDPSEVKLLDQIGADVDFVRMPSVYGGALIFGLGAALCLGLLAVIRLWANPALAELGDASGGATFALAYPAWPLVLAFVALSLICGGAIGGLVAPRVRRLTEEGDGP